jgi:parallel beta-helix repeat protein
MFGGKNGVHLKSISTISLLIFSSFIGMLLVDSYFELGTVEAATITVDDDGPANYFSIQTAISNSNNGDTILVRAGTYNEDVVVLKSVTVIGNSNTDTFINGTGTGDAVLVARDNVVFKNFNVRGSGTGREDAGIDVSDSDFGLIENCDVRQNHNGIRLKTSHNNTITNNLCSDCTYNGVDLERSKFNNINNNTCEQNTRSGIELLNSKGNTIKDNICQKNTRNGMIFQSSNENKIIENKFSDNTDHGLYIHGSTSCTIDSNICTLNNNGNGMYLDASDSNSITNNDCNWNYLDGIKIISSTSVNIFENTCNGNDANGITMDKASGNFILNNTCASNSAGDIKIFQANTNNVSYNILSGSFAGIWLESATGNHIGNNTCDENYDYGIFISSSDTNIIDSNSCSTNIVTGIGLNNSKRNTITNNICMLNDLRGVGLELNSNSNNFRYNKINKNEDYGVYISKSSSNNFLQNKMSSNMEIGLEVTDNSVTNIFEKNNIADNFYGIQLELATSNNWLFHNNIDTNIFQARDNGSNRWHNVDNEGNYWSDYIGFDNGWNDRVAGDGIGDSNIPHQNCDNYPLMKYNGWKWPGIPIIIDTPNFDNDGNYEINWQATRNTIGFALEGDSSISFDSPAEYINDTDTGMSVENHANGTYYYRVRAYNEYYMSGYSKIHTLVIDWLPAIPLEFNLTVDPSGNALNISWLENLEDTKEYQLYSSNETTTIWEPIANIQHPNNTYRHTGLTDGIEYEYKVRAVDYRDQISNYTEIISGIPQDSKPPEPPFGFSIESERYNSITLTWDEEPGSDIIGYKLFRSTTSQSYDYTMPVNGYKLIPNGTYNDTRLDELITYYYVVIAIDEVPNESKPSIEISGTTTLGPHDPEVIKYWNDVDISEDGYDYESIRLLEWFKDINGDTLTFRCTGNLFINITFDQETGTVILQPIKDWTGTEKVTFFASDGVREGSDTINITVWPKNDPPDKPTIISPQNNLKIDFGETIKFNATCTDPDLTDGDILIFTWTSDKAGVIGTGESLDGVILTPGEHKIILQVTDLVGESSYAYVNVTVGEIDTEDLQTAGLLLLGFVLAVFIIIIIIILAVVLILVRRRKRRRMMSMSNGQYYGTPPPVPQAQPQPEQYAQPSPPVPPEYAQPPITAVQPTSTQQLQEYPPQEPQLPLATQVYQPHEPVVTTASPYQPLPPPPAAMEIPIQESAEPPIDQVAPSPPSVPTESIQPTETIPPEEYLNQHPLPTETEPVITSETPIPDQAPPPAEQAPVEPAQTIDQPPTQIKPTMTNEEKIKLLETRLLKGEIDQNLYKTLRAKFEEETENG